MAVARPSAALCRLLADEAGATVAEQALLAGVVAATLVGVAYVYLEPFRLGVRALLADARTWMGVG